MSRTRLFVIATPITLLALGGSIQLGRPLPPPALVVASPRLTLPGRLAVPFPPQGQSAVGEVGLGVAAETPNQEPVPIASVAKIMTAYLLLQARPLKTGEDGPVTTVTPADVETYERAKAAGHSVVRVRAGDRLTERQLLEGLMLPSGGNLATMIAQQVAGSEAAFVARMNEAARLLGMTQTTYADASGVSPATVSTAHDQLLLAQAAMQDRVFRTVVAQPQAHLPSAGTVYNVNFMVGKQGLSGIKTGSTLAAGSCFVGSYPLTIDGRPRILLAAVLGQVSLKEAITADTRLLHAIAPQFKTYELARAGEPIARLSTVWNEQADLALAEPLRVFGYPGMTVQLEARLKAPTLPIAAGPAVATLSATAGTQTATLPLGAARGIAGPSPWWKLLH